jgi:branched-subunit amino acid transport protein
MSALAAGNFQALFCAVVVFVVIALMTALVVEKPILQHNASALWHVHAVFNSALPANLAVGHDNNILVLERIP